MQALFGHGKLVNISRVPYKVPGSVGTRLVPLQHTRQLSGVFPDMGSGDLKNEESFLDRIYRKFIFTRFFQNGWGRYEDMKKILELRRSLGTREEMLGHLSRLQTKVEIERMEDFSSQGKSWKIFDGKFVTPAVHLLPDMVPMEAQTARFQMVLPADEQVKDYRRKIINGPQPVVIHYAGTGDHFFWRRRNLLAKPLLKRSNIGSIILENPFYGTRKPPQQTRSALLHVTDLFIMGCSLICETNVLLNWCEQQGFGPLGVTGISMGGIMACLGASMWDKPLAIIPCLAPTTASCVFTRGVLSEACDWDVLTKQVKSGEHIMNPLEEILHSEINTRKEHYHMSDTDPRKTAIVRMRQLMDEATGLFNYSRPVHTDATIVVCAKHDAYVPLSNSSRLEKIWPGSEIRYVNGGHISSFLTKHDFFVQAIIDSFLRVEKLQWE
eukprot:Nk52_evm6s442 gene=Nk52_evmTU6s442